MNTKLFTLRIIAGSLISLALIFIFSFTARSQEKQDTLKPGKKEKTIVLKVISDDNGKVTVIDTTFSGEIPEFNDQYEFMLKEMEGQKGDMEKQLREMEECMKDMKFDIRIPEIEIPDAPEIEGFTIPHFRGGDVESILNAFPWGNVKSYKIKEYKGGKRIIIDLDDDPVVMFYGPRPGHSHGGHKQVIIHRDMREKGTAPDKDLPAPPPPQPPVPPAQANPPDKG